MTFDLEDIDSRKKRIDRNNRIGKSGTMNEKGE
jgi:hypothetical protein